MHTFMQKNLWIILAVFLKNRPITETLNILPKGKLISDSSLIFMKSFLYLIDSPPFIYLT